VPRRFIDGFWVLPMPLVFAFLAVYLAITKLPASTFVFKLISVVLP